MDQKSIDRENRLSIVSKQLQEDLNRVHIEGDVDGAMGSFLGSPVVQELLATLRTASTAERRAIKHAFRSSIKFLYDGAASFKHCLEKPYGYPGDYLILEHVYHPRPFLETTAAGMGLVDIWGLKSDLARAVRKRKNALRFVLEEKLKIKPDLSILSIASGAAREVREMSESLLSNAEIMLLDSDPRALAVPGGHLRGLAKEPNVKTLEANIITGKGLESLPRANYDLVYSFGLYDYLDDATLLPVISRTLEYLKDGGEYIFCLKDSRFYDAQFYDLFFDWRFVPRVAADGIKIAELSGLKVESCLSIKHGTVVIYRCRRLADAT